MNSLFLNDCWIIEYKSYINDNGDLSLSPYKSFTKYYNKSDAYDAYKRLSNSGLFPSLTHYDHEGNPKTYEH